MLSTLALQIQTVAVGWQLYLLTGSALDLGLVGLAQFVPTVVLTLIVGQVADRCDRRLVVVICHVVEGAAAAALALGTVGGWLSRGGILAVVVVLGAARAFENPSRAALVPRLVPLGELSRAIASVTAAGQMARIMGPALGGALLAWGPATAYATVVGLYALGGVLTALVRDSPPVRVREAITSASLFSGVVFIFQRRLLLGLMSLDLFAVLLGGATALLPIYARDILDTGPGGLGLLRAAPAVGALVMSAVLARYPIGRNAGPMLFGSVLVFGVATVIFGVSTRPRPLAGGARRAGRIRSAEHDHPAVAGAAAHAGRHAGPRERRALAVHRDVEPARRVRVGRAGGAVRRRARGPDRRHRHHRGGRALDVPLSGAATVRAGRPVSPSDP